MDEKQARFVLMETMDESHRAQVRGCKKAWEMIKHLSLVYADASDTNAYRLMHQYYRYVKNQEHNISQHIGFLDELLLNIRVLMNIYGS